MKHQKILLFMILSLFGCKKQSGDCQKSIQEMGFHASVYNSSKYNYSIPYQLFIPKNISEASKYPLILYLHGGGGRGTDNLKQIESGVLYLADSTNQKKYQAFILAPQCPADQQWLNTTFDSAPFTNYRQEDIPESNPIKVVLEIIGNLLNEYPIDPDRLYVTGFSMGGSGTWDVITRHPQLFAAAAPVTGVSDPSKGYLLAKLPLWAFHGAKDQVSLVQNTRNMIDSVKKYSNVWKYTEYPDGDHLILDRAYHEKEFLPWLFLQSKAK